MPPSVLIVEDDAAIRLLFRKLLDRIDCQPLCAASGEEALELLRDHRPSLVLLDLGLPGISGEELLQRIRNEPNLHQTRIAIVSAYPQAAQNQCCEQADYVLTKPVLPKQLIALVNSALNA